MKVSLRVLMCAWVCASGACKRKAPEPGYDGNRAPTAPADTKTPAEIPESPDTPASKAEVGAASGAPGASSDCTDHAVARSRCIIEAILDDVGETYKQIGGGGISQIKQDATWVYTVSISQEERTDLITYTVDLSSGGEVIIKDRKIGTKSYRR